MADFDITITVSGSIGGQAFSWSRSTTIEGIEAAVYGLSIINELIGTPEAGLQTTDGIYSYSGAAVICTVHTNPGTVFDVGALCSDGGVRAQFLVPAFVPMIYYNGAGTGFTGGVNASATSTDTPTIDIAGTTVAQMMGNGPVASLLGLKAIS
jgi:hypothetical protein